MSECQHRVSLDSMPPICGECGEVDPWSKSNADHGELVAIVQELAKLDDAEASDASWPYLGQLIRRARKAVGA